MGMLQGMCALAQGGCKRLRREIRGTHTVFGLDSYTSLY